MDKKSIYIETSIISYLTARPSSDLLAAAWQKITIDIDNAETKPLIRRICQENKYSYPEICTPQELMGVYENG